MNLKVLIPALVVSAAAVVILNAPAAACPYPNPADTVPPTTTLPEDTVVTVPSTVPATTGPATTAPAPPPRTPEAPPVTTVAPVPVPVVTLPRTL
jgi:hypothetical protein